MVVSVAVTDPTAVDDHAVVKQRPATFSDLGKAIEQVSEPIDLVPVDLCDILLLVRALPVM